MSLAFATIPSKRLAQGITSASTSFYVNNIISFNTADALEVESTDLGTQHYVVFRNDTGTKIEIFEIDPATIGTGPITIVRRGLSYYGDRTTEVTANKLDWSANETIVNFGTDAPQLFQYLKEYIDAAAIAGSVPASTTTPGIVERATQAEADAGTGTNGSYDLFVRADSIRGRNVNEYAVDSVGTDAYAITISPAITAYSAGQRFTFKAGTANTGACTLNVSGLGAKTIKKNVSVDLETGDILANQIVEVEYDGTNMQLLSRHNSSIPTVTKFAPISYGASNTRFDITLTGGTTYRYTWDGSGTDPGITAVLFPINSRISIFSTDFTAGNRGTFTVTGSGTNYFEVTNASGVAENDKTLGSTGYLYVLQTTTTYTKPTNLKYAVIEGVGGGGNGGTDGGGGGGAGGYFRKVVSASLLGSTETATVGGPGSTTTFVVSGGSNLTATAGSNGSGNGFGGAGGVGANGDINSYGQDGGTAGGSDTGGGGTDNKVGGGGGTSYFGGGALGGDNGSNGNKSSLFGGGGSGAGSSGTVGGQGAPGIIIITEYYN